MEKAMTLPVRIGALRDCRAAAYCWILFLHAREIPGLEMENVTCWKGCAWPCCSHCVLPLSVHKIFSYCCM